MAYHMLIAEDEVIERMALAKMLKSYMGESAIIHEAENGRQAVDIFKEYPIQIAVLDIEMPVMSGIQAAESIYAANKECCIIFLTAFDRFDYAKKAISVQAMEYLLKPYDAKDLLSVIEAAIYRVDTHKRWRTAEPPVESAEKRGNITSAIAKLMEEYVCAHYREQISMQDAAAALNYSEAYFCKVFKQQFGQSFTSYLTEFRIEDAKKLLRCPTVNIKSVGEQVGYIDSNYFAKVFRRITGLSPSEYRLENC